MADLQAMMVDSAIEPWGSTPEFEAYDNKVAAYNQKLNGTQNTFNASELLQQAAQLLSKNPELAMTM